MAVRDTTTSWGWPARLIHWVMAALILFMLGLGFWVSDFETDIARQIQLTFMHKSFGFTIFVLAVIRVVWRLFNRRATPALPVEMPRWQHQAAEWSHRALYFLIFAIPLTGWLMASSSPLNDEGAYPVRLPNLVFGLFEMPDPYPVGSKELSDMFHTIHQSLSLVLIAILVVHAGAALKHHVIDRDDVLKRMTVG
jgi:cytochrome b561